MDARRQAIKEEVHELRKALKKLDVEPDDTSTTIAKLLRGEAQEVYEIDEWYSQRGRESQQARLVEARDVPFADDRLDVRPQARPSLAERGALGQLNAPSRAGTSRRSRRRARGRAR